MTVERVIHNVHVVAEEGDFFGGVAIHEGVIVAMGRGDGLPEGREVTDGKGLTLLPGGVDPHVHIRYPGSPHRETFESGTRAAAAGGTTTIIEHPISTPPQYSVDILQKRVDALAGQAYVDVAFLGAAGGDKLEDIEEIGRAGILGYKTFLHAAPEGREEEFAGLTSRDNFELLSVMERVAKTGLPMAAHGEDNDLVAGMIRQLRSEGKTAPINHVHSRPPLVEVMAVERLIRLGKLLNAPLYLVHISTPEAVEIACKARNAGQKIWIESCPQYFYCTEEEMNKHGAYAKCNPALRDAQSVEKMWELLQNGSIDCIGSDHAPYTVEEKERNPDDIFKAPAGFPGLETRIPLLLDAVHKGKISLRRAVNLMSTNPAKAFGIYPKKGAIRIGGDADFILIDREKPHTVDSGKMETMSAGIAKVFDGMRLFGSIESSILRGKTIYDAGKITGAAGFGQWVRK